MTRRDVATGSAVCAVLLVLTGAIGCTSRPSVLTRQAEARQLAARLHLEFSQANEAANRAVMADTEYASAQAAQESERASASAVKTTDALRPVLESLTYNDESNRLARFIQKFDEYRRLDAEVLPLAAENTNLKAQRLSFEAGQTAADGLFTAIAAASGARPSAETAVQIAECRAAVLSIQVIQARHIAEADDTVMNGLEAAMGAADTSARGSINRLRELLPAAGSQLNEASAALDRFMSVNRQIVELSRRNSNVRSLALSLGRKRVVAAECEDDLRALEEGLAAHMFKATR